MKLMNGIAEFDVATMEALVQTDPMLRMAHRALEEMGTDRKKGLLALYCSYVLGSSTPEEAWVLNN